MADLSVTATHIGAVLLTSVWIQSRVALANDMPVVMVLLATVAEKDGHLDVLATDLHNRCSKVGDVLGRKSVARVEHSLTHTVAQHGAHDLLAFNVDLRVAVLFVCIKVPWAAGTAATASTSA